MSSGSNDLTNEFYSTIVMHKRVLQMLNDELARIIGPKAASALNYQQGISVGKSLVSKFNLKLSTSQLFMIYPLFFKIGKLSGLIERVYNVERERNNIVARIRTSISNRKKKYNYKTCSFFAGEVKGIAEALTGKKWSCVETKCYSIGDEYDEFVLKPEE